MNVNDIFNMLKSAVVDRAIPLVEQALPFARFVAMRTATTLDDEAIKSTELGIFICREVFNDPDIAAAIQRYVEKNKATLEAKVA